MELEERIIRGVKWYQESIKEFTCTYILQSRQKSYTFSGCKLVCHRRCPALRRRLIAFSSTALSENQKSYPQIEKKALAIKHGCQKFQKYIYATDVVIETDHRPLESFLKKKKKKHLI